ncbi:MAG: glycosyltransferase family 4 protein [Ignavibacteria bacterium]
MNILISCGSYSWGGLEMISLETAKKLRETGLVAKILCSKNSRLEEESNKQGFETLPYFSKNTGIISSIFKLKRFLSNNNIDVIHSNHSHDLWVLAPALKLSGSNAKLFLTKHMASGIKKTDMLHKYLYNRVNGIFAISRYIEQSVKDTCPVPFEKIHLLPVGIDLDRFDNTKLNKNELKKKYLLPVDKLLIGIVGRITPGKGHEEFLEAAKIITEKHSGTVHFVVIGNASFGEEKYEEEIKILAKTLKIENITFTGYTSEPQKLIGVLDILAMPSHNESFGRVLLEAMALMVPVAASGNAGVIDIVIDNESGLLFEPKNSKQMAVKLMKLVESSKLRTKFAENGYKRVKDVFAFQIMTDKLIKFYTN